jgi:RimJ/RimL family protein N-acetyltransferase
MKLIPIQRGGVVESEALDLPDDVMGVLHATSSLYQAVGFQPPWICYVAFQDGRPVGTCGFKSAPANGRVEIAYFTFPGFEGRGIATSMAEALVQLATQSDSYVTVAAQTLPERNASHRVLEKLGFENTGSLEHPEDGTVLEWQKLARRVAQQIAAAVGDP